MIGKPEWFSPRKFGWGLGIRTKEGWLYVLAFVLLVLAISALPFEQKGLLIGALVAVLVIDVLHIMITVYSNLDEREQKHEALAERNASFVAVVGLISCLLFLAYAGAEGMIIFPVLILVGMAIAKGATQLYLERAG